jgi:hypothetical protein
MLEVPARFSPRDFRRRSGPLKQNDGRWEGRILEMKDCEILRGLA